ncbi:MAG: Holliday junction resolvase RuvX [Alphaproteobacteria bacterium]
MLYNDINLFKTFLISNKRIIGLDVGSKKIGIAISDLSKTISNPYSLMIRTNIKNDLEKINSIIKDEYCGFVIGLPKMMNGEEGEACVVIRKFANFILEKFKLPIYLQDERLSTSAALRALSESNYTRKRKNLMDDKISASLILQNTLDHINMIS